MFTINIAIIVQIGLPLYGASTATAHDDRGRWPCGRRSHFVWQCWWHEPIIHQRCLAWLQKHSEGAPSRLVALSEWLMLVCWRKAIDVEVTVDDHEPVSGSSGIGSNDLNTDGILWLGQSTEIVFPILTAEWGGSGIMYITTTSNYWSIIRISRNITKNALNKKLLIQLAAILIKPRFPWDRSARQISAPKWSWKQSPGTSSVEEGSVGITV